MNDPENYVYTQVRAAVLEAYPSADTASEYTDTPAQFPFVSCEMTDNSVLARFMTAQNREFASSVTFTVNIFSNSEFPKTQAKDIAEIVDSTMKGMGFRRSLYLRTPNVDRTIYRLTLRYSGIVSAAYDGAEDHFNISAR